MFDFDRHSHHFSLSPNIQYIGQDKAVTAKASNGVALHVYPACDQTAPTCDIKGAFYGASSVAWTAAAGVEYLLLVTST